MVGGHGIAQRPERGERQRERARPPVRRGTCPRSERSPAERRSPTLWHRVGAGRSGRGQRRSARRTVPAAPWSAPPGSGRTRRPAHRKGTRSAPTGTVASTSPGCPKGSQGLPLHLAPILVRSLIGYARLSTIEQGDSGLGLAAQEVPSGQPAGPAGCTATAGVRQCRLREFGAVWLSLVAGAGGYTSDQPMIGARLSLGLHVELATVASDS